MAYIDIHDQPGPHRDFFDIPATAVAGFGAMGEYPIWHAPFNAKVRFVAFVFGEGGMGGSGAQYTQILTRDKGLTGIGTTLLETTSFTSPALEFESYLVYDPLALAGQLAYYSIDSGDVLSIQYVAGGVGRDVPPIHGYVEYEGR